MDNHGLYAYIENNVAALKRPAIIGINGAITSGKTMFAQMLEQYLKDKGYHTQMIHIDDFHNPRSIRMKDNSPECYFQNAIDTHRFGELMRDIKRGPVTKTMTLLNMGTDTYSDNKVYITDTSTLVIVEGVLLYSPSISHFFDYKIFLDVDYGEILQRGKERDVPLYGEDILQQYIDLYIPVQKIYENLCAPREQSNLVINNNNVREPMVIKRRQQA